MNLLKKMSREFYWFYFKEGAWAFMILFALVSFPKVIWGHDTLVQGIATFIFFSIFFFILYYPGYKDKTKKKS